MSVCMRLYPSLCSCVLVFESLCLSLNCSICCCVCRSICYSTSRSEHGSMYAALSQLFCVCGLSFLVCGMMCVCVYVCVKERTASLDVYHSMRYPTSYSARRSVFVCPLLLLCLYCSVSTFLSLCSGLVCLLVCL